MTRLAQLHLHLAQLTLSAFGHDLGIEPRSDAVARLLGGVRPHLLVSDPPYGVSYDPGWRNETGASKTPIDFVSSHHYPSDPSCSRNGSGGKHTWEAECFSLDVLEAADESSAWATQELRPHGQPPPHAMREALAVSDFDRDPVHNGDQKVQHPYRGGEEPSEQCRAAAAPLMTGASAATTTLPRASRRRC